ncbi:MULTISPECIES: hypothetical protein [unclassified Bosea (in: a-proteobacteria)]|uniref:hypothetical protein n=1 Tax=unclassified Bosea (in: a-proteobacteria) TaxID=2653178 RepID=UPI000F7DFD51|nr:MULTISPECIES: hypothetical protein [unclassified Bosea (in: a-proteobacteria)]
MILLGWLALFLDPRLSISVVLGAGLIAFVFGDLFLSFAIVFIIAWLFERFLLTDGSDFSFENYTVVLVPALIWSVLGIALGLFARKSKIK